MIESGDNYAVYRLPKSTKQVVTEGPGLTEYVQIEVHTLTCNPQSRRILLHVQVYGFTAPGRYYYGQDDPIGDDQSDLLTFHGGDLQSFATKLSVKLVRCSQDEKKKADK